MHHYLIHRVARYCCQERFTRIFLGLFLTRSRVGCKQGDLANGESRRSGRMSVSIPSAKRSEIVYPESDGKPMAENTLQFQWIVTIKEGLAREFSARPDVFVAGDLLWYPVEGRPDICAAPDAMVAIGRPAGFRGCYK